MLSNHAIDALETLGSATRETLSSGIASCGVETLALASQAEEHGQHQDAEVLVREALNSLPEGLWRTHAEILLGKALLAQGKYASALEPLFVAARCKDLEVRVAAQSDTAKCYLNLADYQRALEVASDALSCTPFGTHIYADLQLSLGIVHVHLESYDEAIETFEDAIETFESLSHNEKLLESSIHLSRAYQRRGDYTIGLQVMTKAMNYLDSNISVSRKAAALSALGVAQRLCGKLSEAEQFSQNALKLKKAAGLEGLETDFRNLALLAVAMKDEDNALKFFSEAESCCLRNGDLSELELLYEDMIEFFECLGDAKSALKHCKSLIELKETINFDRTRKQLASAQQTLQTEQLRRVVKENKTLLSELERQTRCDALTGAYNRRHFNEVAQKEAERARRSDSSLIVAISDIDFFKRVNDAFGHQMGDEVLIQVAGLLRKSIRSGDTVARWGGEEFALLLPETRPATAYEIVERIRRVIEGFNWKNFHNDLSVTMSFGVSLVVSSVQDALDEADQGLYRSKEAGRNRTTFCGKIKE